MLFVVDIGNSNIVLGMMETADKVIFAGRIKTVKTMKAGQLFEKFREAVRENNVPLNKADGAMIASVVPEITQEAADAVKKLTGIKPMKLSSKLNTGLTIDTDEPSTVGSDLIAASAAAAKEYDGAVAVFDLGTATTLSVVSEDRRYLGTIIMPGVFISLNAMVHRASQLHRFDIEQPEHLIGKNTVESMCSGVLYGNAAMMDGLIERVEEQLGTKVTVLVTGGIGKMIQPYCKHEMKCERDLVLKGLWYIYHMNKEDKK